MHIEHIKMFINTVERGSISLVAQSNNISQSALSQQIQNLERDFNTKLLIRSHKGVELTPAGKIVYEHSLKIVKNQEQIYTKLNLLTSQCANVKILATPIAYSYALPCTFFTFKNTYPDCHLEMESDCSTTVEEKILSEYADIGIISFKSNDKRLQCYKAFSDEIILVAGANFKIPSKITKQELYNYPLLTLSKGRKTQEIIEFQLKNNGIDLNKLNVLYSLDSAESLKLSAINGYGLALLPYMSIKKELYNKQLRAIKCDNINFEHTYYSITKKDNKGVANEFMVDNVVRMINDTIC